LPINTTWNFEILNPSGKVILVAILPWTHEVVQQTARLKWAWLWWCSLSPQLYSQSPYYAMIPTHLTLFNKQQNEWTCKFICNIWLIYYPVFK